MIDITKKPNTEREAIAKCEIIMKEETLKLIKEDKIEKGNVFEVAKTAGILSTKYTPFLIPFTHPILITSVKIEFSELKDPKGIEIQVKVKSIGKTGVEMEALTAAAISALTIYDMCKGFDKTMIISNLRLVKKTGGKSGDFARE